MARLPLFFISSAENTLPVSGQILTAKRKHGKKLNLRRKHVTVKSRKVLGTDVRGGPLEKGGPHYLQCL